MMEIIKFLVFSGCVDFFLYYRPQDVRDKVANPISVSESVWNNIVVFGVSLLCMETEMYRNLTIGGILLIWISSIIVMSLGVAVYRVSTR